MQAHCQSPTSQPTDQSFVKELAKPTHNKIVFKKFPDPSKKNKKRNPQPDTNRQKSKQIMTLKLNTDNGLQGRTDRTPAANSRLPQWGMTWLIEVQCFYQDLCLVDSEVLRNPPLRQAAKRYKLF